MHVVYMKYVQLFVWQSFPNKVVRKNVLRHEKWIHSMINKFYHYDRLL